MVTMSNYKKLVEDDEENGNDELEDRNKKTEVRQELFTVESSKQMKKPKWMTPSKRSKLKKLRKVIFLSMFVGFIVTFVLLYCLVMVHRTPKCVPHHQPLRTKWNLTVAGIDISTKISLASKNTKEIDLAFGYLSTHKTNEKGVMMVNGTSGSIMWKQNLFTTPSHLDCQSIDVDKDGKKDCLAAGPNMLLTCLSSVTGKPFWYVHTHKSQQLVMEMSSPLVTSSDFNSGGVHELLTMATVAGGQRYLMFVSGESGIMIGDLLPFPSWCTQVTSPLKIVYESSKSYLAISCVMNNTGEIWLADIEELYVAAKKPSLQTVHSPLFYNIFQCEEPASQISLFSDESQSKVVAACNNGEVAAIDISSKKISWRTVLPYFTHSRVMSADPSFMNNKLITLWSEANETQSMIVVFSMKNGEIEWRYSPPAGEAVSMVLPFYSRKYRRKFEILVKTTRCHETERKGSNVSCHCVVSFSTFDPYKRSTRSVMKVNRFLNMTHKCKIPKKRSITSAVVGDMLGDNSKQAVLVKQCESSTHRTSQTLDFNTTLKMIRIKASEEC